MAKEIPVENRHARYVQQRDPGYHWMQQIRLAESSSIAIIQMTTSAILSNGIIQTATARIPVYDEHLDNF
jgi:hypothetical protein